MKDSIKVLCPKCGKYYKQYAKYETIYDNWNLGHYGCDTPKEVGERFVGYYGFCDNCLDIKKKQKKKKHKKTNGETIISTFENAKIVSKDKHTIGVSFGNSKFVSYFPRSWWDEKG